MTTLQETDRGCSYDRAGLGLSEPAPKPRTTGDQVEDLHSLLAAAGLKPPYILVGHSSGGWNVMVYGDKYPDDVSGVVMVDVRPPAFSERTPRRCRRRALASPKRSSRPDPRKRGRRIQAGTRRVSTLSGAPPRRVRARVSATGRWSSSRRVTGLA